jgi:hypothetical protein
MTDTTISTDPATLRQAAYGIAQSYPAIADILYTIAAEKEAQAAPEPAAWSFQIARSFFADGSPAEWSHTQVSLSPPAYPPDARNLTPLYRWPRAYTAGESLGGGLVAVPAPERPVIQCARCAGKGEFLDTTYDRTGEMVWCRPCHGTGKMLDDRDVKAALAALTEKGERS